MAAATAVLVSATASLAADKPASAGDRACLIKLTDQYLAAVVAHDPSKAPLASNLVFAEDIKRMKPGEGLWKTATGGPTAFKIYVPDVTVQQAGWLGVIQQDGKPADLPAAHVFKIGPEGQIHEIEAIGFLAPFNASSGWERTAYAASFVQPKKP